MKTTCRKKGALATQVVLVQIMLSGKTIAECAEGAGISIYKLRSILKGKDFFFPQEIVGIGHCLLGDGKGMDLLFRVEDFENDEFDS